jgi:outer membrane protein assembly factor BamA
MYLQLGSIQRILALRGFLQVDDADPGNRVPFYLQEALGGSHTLRGFSSFRLRGEKVLLLQAEYRWEASPALELVLFADAGSVGLTDRPWNPDDLAFDWGAGVRLKTWKDVLMRFDWGHSHETDRFLLRFSSSY